MANTNEHPPEHTATPAPSEQPATPTSTSGLWPDFYGPKLAELQLESNEITSTVAYAIACDGQADSEESFRPHEWEKHCQGDVKVFYPGTTHSEVSNYLDGLGIKGNHKAEILEQIFC